MLNYCDVRVNYFSLKEICPKNSCLKQYMTTIKSSLGKKFENVKIEIR